jgi:hypothetical protein
LRFSIGQVSQEDETPALGMIAILGVLEMMEKASEGVDLTVDIAHDIDGSGKERTDEGCHDWRTQPSGTFPACSEGLSPSLDAHAIREASSDGLRVDVSRGPGGQASARASRSPARLLQVTS